jgi:iron-sulfur cluster repair protein YtfE (RIC family)
VAALAEAVEAGQPHADARRAVLEYLEGELLPHARAEEEALYPAGDVGLASLLVRSMRDEHVNLIAHVEAFGSEDGAITAASRAAAILALFESHLHKENDLLIPALVADESVSLGALLDGMHRLLG